MSYKCIENINTHGGSFKKGDLVTADQYEKVCYYYDKGYKYFLKICDTCNRV